VLVETRIKSTNLELRCLSGDEVTSSYLGWLNEPSVNQYLEVRHNPPTTVEELTEALEATNASDDSILFGIFLSSTSTHIGNIKIGPINWIHKRAEVGILIGDSTQWGKGYATEAIRSVCDYAGGELGLTRLIAGCYSENEGSKQAFIKAGFFIEAILPNFWVLPDGGSSSEYVLGWTKSQDERPYWSAGDVQNICFIGGGDQMLRTMEFARNLGFQVGAFLSERHAKELLKSGLTLAEGLSEQNLPFHVATSVDEVSPAKLFKNPSRTLAVGMGPAWVFPLSVIQQFEAGAVNFNGIPLPQYMGGAHYTWQILNESRSGGCYIQEISTAVDKGLVLMGQNFDLPNKAKLPSDFFRWSDEEADRFLIGFIQRIKKKGIFQGVKFEQIEMDRTYFPRLSSSENGWIDWSWSGRHIALFCDAFSSPYPGAQTMCKNRRVFILKARLVPSPRGTTHHPFTCGLVSRKLNNKIFVAVSGGFLEVHEWLVDGGGVINEGDRLFTPQEQLERARTFTPKYS